MGSDWNGQLSSSYKLLALVLEISSLFCFPLLLVAGEIEPLLSFSFNSMFQAETQEKINNSKLLKELSNDAAKKKKVHYLLSQLQ